MSAAISKLLAAFGKAPPPPAPVPYADAARALAAAALAGSALGFVRPVWFISIGESVWMGWGMGARAGERAGRLPPCAARRRPGGRPHATTADPSSSPQATD
jgi:hypothetical protein